MKRISIAIFVTLLTMASTSFAATQNTNTNKIQPTLQVSATVQSAIRLTLGTATGGCPVNPGSGGNDYAIDFGTVDALTINTGNCVGAGAGKYAPTTPGQSDDAIYYTSYALNPEFTSQAATTNTITAYVSTNFAANSPLSIVNGGVGASAPAQASFSAMSTSAPGSTVATNAASGTALTGWIGVKIAHTSGAAVVMGAQTAVVTYTLTVQ